MGRFRKILLPLGMLLLSAACSRPISEDFSTISIQIPQNGVFGKAGNLNTLSAPPAGRKACYGVNVTGDGIPTQQSNSCSPTAGVLAGFVEAGQTVEALVPKGPGRKIELFLYLQAVGENLPCPKLSASFSAAQIAKTYLMGTATADLTQAVESVEITASFPGLSQTIAQQLSLPANCSVVNNESLLGFGISTASGSSDNGSTIYLHGRVGRVEENKVLTGSNIKLYVRE